MRPASFSCEATLPLNPEEIAGRILDLSNWPSFRGCGPVPGVKAAVFESRTPEIVGSRVRVTNTDGSGHVEEIVEWRPGERLRLEMTGFSPPLSRLANRFEETWAFKSDEGGTRVIRSFRLLPRSSVARWPLRVIAFFLKRAVARHLREMR